MSEDGTVNSCVFKTRTKSTVSPFPICNPRGIAPKQNLDPYILPVLEEKFKEFGSVADEYQKQASDMKLLTQIYEKWENKISLNKDELRFLYEIDNKIQGFGYGRDPRLQEILDSKDENTKRTDLVFIFGCNPNQISFTKEEALSGDIVYHLGDLDLRSLKSYEGDFPKHVRASLNLESLESYEGDFPKHVGGYLNLRSLESYEGDFPKHVGGDLDLRSLESFKGNLPDYVGFTIYLDSKLSEETKNLFIQKFGEDKIE